MQDYVNGPLFAALQATPGIFDVNTRDFALLEAPTALTLPAPTSAL